MTEPQKAPAAPAPPAPVKAYDSALMRLAMVQQADVEADPNRYEAIGQQNTIMRDKQGREHNVPASSAQIALDQGWTFLPHEQAAHEKRVEFYKEKHGGAFRVGVGQAINQMAFGTPDIIAEHEWSPEELEGQRRARKESPTANVVGGAAGLAASIATGSALGRVLGPGSAAADALHAKGLVDGARAGATALEMASPGIGQRVLSATARGALEGAAYSAPQAVTHLAYGDPNQAAEAILWGLGTGGVLGLGAGAFSEGVRGLKGVARDQALAHGIMSETGEINHGRIRELMGVGPKLPAELVGKTPAELSVLQEQIAGKLGEHGAALDTAIRNAPKAVSEKLGVVPTELAAKVHAQVIEPRSAALPAMEREQLEGVVKALAKGGNKPIAFAELDRMAGPGMLEQLSALPAESAAAKLGKQVATVIETEKARAMNEAYASLGLKEGFGSYLAQKEQLMQVAQALQATTGAPIMNPLANRMAGLASGMGTKAIAGTLGGIAGHAVGGPFGGYVGYKAIRGVADKVLGGALNSKALELSTRVLTKIADNPESISWLGPALAKDATAAVASKVGGVQSALTRAAGAAGKADPIKAALGPHANGLSKDQQFDRLTQQLTATANDPERMRQETETVGHLFAKDPMLQTAVTQKQEQAVKYLADAVPKQPVPKPFEKTPPPVSAAEKKAFLEKLEVAHNPWAVMNHVSDGTLTKNHVEALATLYPGLHAQMTAEVGRMAHDPTSPSISNGVKHGLSMLTGVNLTNFTGTNYQMAYQNPAKSGPASPPKKSKGAGSSRAHLNETPSLATAQTRLEFKGVL